MAKAPKQTLARAPKKAAAKTPARRPVGRPTKYDPIYCDRVVELAKDGLGRIELAAELGVTRQTLATWEEAHPEFLAATTRAAEISGAWWAKQGRMGIWAGKDFNANAYRLQVMNRFPADWRDKQDIEHSGGTTVTFQTVYEQAPKK